MLLSMLRKTSPLTVYPRLLERTSSDAFSKKEASSSVFCLFVNREVSMSNPPSIMPVSMLLQRLKQKFNDVYHCQIFFQEVLKALLIPVPAILHTNASDIAKSLREVMIRDFTIGPMPLPVFALLISQTVYQTIEQ